MRSFRFFATLAVMLSLWSVTLAQSSGFDTSRMDRSAEACDDFFQFANGTWLKNTEIPAAFSSWGTFQSLRDSNNAILKEILDSAATSKVKTGTDTQMIGDFYTTCMD